MEPYKTLSELLSEALRALANENNLHNRFIALSAFHAWKEDFQGEYKENGVVSCLYTRYNGVRDTLTLPV